MRALRRCGRGDGEVVNVRGGILVGWYARVGVSVFHLPLREDRAVEIKPAAVEGDELGVERRLHEARRGELAGALAVVGGGG